MTQTLTQSQPARSQPARSQSLLLCLTLGVTLWRLANVIFGQMPLIADEAQYWTWAKDLDWGYFTKPPMIAWVIALPTALCGDGDGCARLSAPLFHGATTVLVGAFAARLFGVRTGLWSGLVYLTLPGVSFAALMISTDTPLLFFAALATYGLVRLRETPVMRWAALIGGAVGLGFLSKYAMSYWLIGLAAAFVLDPTTRRALSLRTLGIIAGLAILVLLPNLIWNATNGFVTITHLGDNANISAQRLVHFDNLAEFLLSQLAVFGPILFPIFVVLLIRPQSWREGDMRLLLCLALPALIMVTFQAFLNRANANWAAMAYLTATPFVVQAILTQARPILLSLSVGLGVASLALIGVVWMSPQTFNRVDAIEGLYRRHARGPAVVGEMKPELDLGLYAGVIADDRKMVANLIYHGRDRDLKAWRLPREDGLPVDYYTQKQPLPDRLDRPVLLLFRNDENIVHPRLRDVTLLRRFETPGRSFALYAARVAPKAVSEPN